MKKILTFIAVFIYLFIYLRCDMAFIEPMHSNKPNITYLLIYLFIYLF